MIQKKIVMVGAVSVGKTSLVARYVHSLFSEKYLSTVGVKIDKKTITVDGIETMLMLWDVAGDDDFQPIQTSYLRGAAGYLLVADGSRRNTLTQAVGIQRRVVDAIGSVPFLLLLNKADLVDQWQVDAPQIRDLAAQGWPVHRTSAKTGSGVEEAFLEIARKVLGPGPGA